jgi:hypothetical protein
MPKIATKPAVHGTVFCGLSNKMHKWAKNDLLVSKLDAQHNFEVDPVHHGSRKKISTYAKKGCEEQNRLVHFLL